MLTETLIPDPVVEIIHGVTIADKYRWLEDRNLPITEAWIADQKRIHDEYFTNLPGLEALRTRVRNYLNIEAVDQPARVGDRTFFRRRKKDQEQPCICVRDAISEQQRILVDPSSDGLFASVAIHRISDDGRILAYAVKHGGERTEALRFVEVNSGKILPDQLEIGLSRGLAFTEDGHGFFYCHDTQGEIGAMQPHRIRYHRFGAPADQDGIIFEAARTLRSRLVLFSDRTHLGAALVYDTGKELKTDLYVASHVASWEWHPVYLNRDAPYGPFLWNGGLYAQSFAGAPNGRICELNADGSEGRTIVPESRLPMQGLRLAGERILITYLESLETIIHCWTRQGKFYRSLPTLPGGSFALLPGYANICHALFFSYESFTQPPAVFQFSEQTNSYTPWMQPEIPDSPPCLSVQRVCCTSKDGTCIPMSLVMSTTAQPDGARPTILTGYGGFRVSMSPRFSVLVAIMLELGAVFALPNIRGGSEFGEDWYRAARGRNRQTAYDDFLSAAEWLCAQEITDAEHLAIFGGSNSGLLVGAAMTQRPDLFRAVVCIAPILDMLRYEQFGDSRKWKDEYGTVDDPEEFHALLAYSPYHQVRDDQNYPATLFVAGDKDAQCDPAHVRKMAARLQGRNSQSRPILVDYSQERGHSAVLPLSVRVDALTRRLAFLCHEIGISIPEEETV